MEDALPRILISNDDGVSAPGLRALVEALNRHKFCEIYVCGPFGERSGQSQSITRKLDSLDGIAYSRLVNLRLICVCSW